MSSVIPTHQDLSNDTTFSQIKSCVPVPLREKKIEIEIFAYYVPTYRVPVPKYLAD